MLLAAEPAAPVAPAPTLLMAEPAKPIPAPPMNDEKEEVDDWNDYRWANCYI
jgi:hypothetical protein